MPQLKSNNPLSIGFVLDDSLDSTDGVQQYVLTLGKWLSDQGHTVHYLVGQTARQDLANVHSLSHNMAVRFNGNRMSMPLPTSRGRIRALLAREHFDVLHIQMPYSPFMGAKIIQNAPAHTAVVGTFHILPFNRVHRAAARALAMWLRSSQGRLDHIFSVSEPAQTFAASLGIPTTVLPNVVDLAAYAHAKPLPAYKQNFTIVFLGRLVERKGCMELLRAVDRLVRRGSIPTLRVLICGKGQEAAQLKAWAHLHKLDNYVTFVGYVSEEDKPHYLASADIAVFPSLGGESFGIVLLEAMAAGAGVVVGGNNPGYASVLGEGSAALFDPANTGAFADLLQRLHAEPSLRKQLHAHQQQLVQDYAVARVAPKLVSYYRTILAKHKDNQEA